MRHSLHQGPAILSVLKTSVMVLIVQSVQARAFARIARESWEDDVRGSSMMAPAVLPCAVEGVCTRTAARRVRRHLQSNAAHCAVCASSGSTHSKCWADNELVVLDPRTSGGPLILAPRAQLPRLLVDDGLRAREVSRRWVERHARRPPCRPPPAIADAKGAFSRGARTMAS